MIRGGDRYGNEGPEHFSADSATRQAYKSVLNPLIRPTTQKKMDNPRLIQSKKGAGF